MGATESTLDLNSPRSPRNSPRSPVDSLSFSPTLVVGKTDTDSPFQMLQLPGKKDKTKAASGKGAGPDEVRLERGKLEKEMYKMLQERRAIQVALEGARH